MRFSFLVAAAAGVVLAGTALGVTADAWHDDRGKRGVEQLPVITPSKDLNTYPLAEIHATLTLRKGCLLLGGSVVFWPLGTTWDASTQEVRYEDGGAAPVGKPFVGGGGVYSLDDIRGWLDAEPAGAIEDCMERTGSDGAVFAYLDD